MRRVSFGRRFERANCHHNSFHRVTSVMYSLRIHNTALCQLSADTPRSQGIELYCTQNIRREKRQNGAKNKRWFSSLTKRVYLANDCSVISYIMQQRTLQTVYPTLKYHPRTFRHFRISSKRVRIG